MFSALAPEFGIVVLHSTACRESVESTKPPSRVIGGAQDSPGFRKRGLQDEVVRRPHKTPGTFLVGTNQLALAA